MKLTAKEARSLQILRQYVVWYLEDISRRDASRVTRNMKLITKIRKSNAKNTRLINKESKKWNIRKPFLSNLRICKLEPRRSKRNVSYWKKKNIRDEGY